MLISQGYYEGTQTLSLPIKTHSKPPSKRNTIPHYNNTSTSFQWIPKVQASVQPPIEAPKIVDTKTTLPKVKPTIQLHWIFKPLMFSTKFSKQTVPLTTPPTIMVPKLHDISPFAPTFAAILKCVPPS